jgi:menaquinone-dependent protoporphyrinogen oxidase
MTVFAQSLREGETVMRVLVVVASRHGATEQIAAEIAKTLRIALSADLPGTVVDLRSAEQVDTLDGCHAVVLGSAVYMGRWLPAAREFADRHADALATLPVWLFSSGPIGEPPKPDQDPADVAKIAAGIAARDHHTFTGQLDRHRLSFAERTVVRAVHAAEGDFRDWPAIREWAIEIGAALRGHPVADEPAGTRSG